MGKHQEFKKKAWTILPYIYFVVLAAFWLASEMIAEQNFSYAAFGVVMVLISQAIIQNKTIGVSLGIFALAVNVLFFLAVVSEFCEFEVITASAIQLIAVGSILSLSGMAMGVVLTTTNGKELIT
jgi:hypothetical protein